MWEDEEEAKAAEAKANAEDDWLPDSAFQSLRLEREMVHPEESNAQTSRRMLDESAPVAVAAILHIAKYGTNERTRLTAAQYVVDRVLGRIGDDVNAGEKDPLEMFLGEVSKFANENQV